MDRILSITIDRSLDYANDIAEIETLPGGIEAELYSTFTLEPEGAIREYMLGRFRGTIPLFSGVVMERKVEDGFETYTITAPSVFLTRGEVDIDYDGTYSASFVVGGILPLGFTHNAPDDEVELNGTMGRVIMDVLEDVANQLGVDLYVDGWEVIFGERETDSVATHAIADSDILSWEDEIREGGTDVYSLVKGYATINNDGHLEEIEVEERIFETDYDMVDIIMPADIESSDTATVAEQKLRKAVHERAEEIRRALVGRRKLEIFLNPFIKPGDFVLVKGVKYKVIALTHEIKPRMWKTILEVEK